MSQTLEDYKAIVYALAYDLIVGAWSKMFESFRATSTYFLLLIWIELIWTHYLPIGGLIDAKSILTLTGQISGTKGLPKHCIWSRHLYIASCHHDRTKMSCELLSTWFLIWTCLHSMASGSRCRFGPYRKTRLLHWVPCKQPSKWLTCMQCVIDFVLQSILVVTCALEL